MNKEYKNFRYLYPPRPETKSPESSLEMYQGRGFIGQPKLNGSCAVVFLDGKSAKIMNRHNDTFSRKTIDSKDLESLHRGKDWMVLVGELMNKSQKNVEGKPLRGFVIFDILVYDGKYLTGSTFIERQDLLRELHSGDIYDTFIDKISDNIYRVNNFTELTAVYQDLIKIPMYEGLVVKKPTGKLKPGYNAKNNTLWQAKIRKPTKNYQW